MSAEDVIRWQGPDALRPLLEPIAAVVCDPANVRRHPARSLEAIKGSFARFGQQFPAVRDGNGVVRDGNGRLEAARALGWTHFAVVPSDLPPTELAAYGLAANRTGELSEWDHEALASTLKALQAEGAAIADLGWADYELEPLLAADWSPDALGDLPGSDEDGPPEMGDPIHLTKDQREVVDRAIAKCRVMAEDRTLSEGRCLELVSADYLAGPG